MDEKTQVKTMDVKARRAGDVRTVEHRVKEKAKLSVPDRVTVCSHTNNPYGPCDKCKEVLK